MAGKAPRIQVEGAKELRAAMKRMGADLGDMTAINKSAAQTVAGQARSIVPVLTGRLMGSIRPLATRTRGQVAAGNKSVPYAGPIHFGWPARNISADPFLWDALESKEGEVIEKYEAHIEALVLKLDRETP